MGFSFKNPLRSLLRRTWQKGLKYRSPSLRLYTKARSPQAYLTCQTSGGDCHFSQHPPLKTLVLNFETRKAALSSVLFNAHQALVKQLPMPAQQLSLCFILLEPPAFKIQHWDTRISSVKHQNVAIGRDLFTDKSHQISLGENNDPKHFRPKTYRKVAEVGIPQARTRTMRFMSRSQMADPTFFQLPVALRPTRVSDLSKAETDYYLKILGEQAGCSPGRLVLRKVYRSVPVSQFQEFSMRPPQPVVEGASTLNRNLAVSQLLKTKDWLWATPKLDSVLEPMNDNGSKQAFYNSTHSVPLMDLVFGMRLDTQEALRAVIPVL